MNLKETMQLISDMKDYYPYIKIDDINRTAKAWYKHFNKIDYQDVANALEVYVESDNGDHPPTIHQLKELAKESVDEVLSAYDAFDLVLEALNGDWYDGWKDLPDSVKRVIKSPANLKRLSMMNQETLITSYKNQFVREYSDKNRRKTPVGDYEPRVITEDMIDRDEFKKAAIKVKNGTYLTEYDWEWCNWYGGSKYVKECKGQPINLGVNK